MTLAPSSVHALLMAGQRRGVDPLADHFGTVFKVLVPLAGVPMLSRVARTLADHPAIGRVTIIAQDVGALTADPACASLRDHPAIEFSTGREMISLSVLDAMGNPTPQAPVLIATADHPLLDRAMISEFLDKGLATRSDIAVALVERSILLRIFPNAKRTWLRFRGGAYSGANLFLLTGARAREVVGFWTRIEADRKKGRKIAAAFGPWLFLGVLLRILSLHQAIALAGRKLGARIAAIEMSDPVACIDVDKIEDHKLATHLIGLRQSVEIREKIA